MTREVRGKVRSVGPGTVDVRAGGLIHNCNIAPPLTASDIQEGDVVGIFWVYDTPHAFCILSRVTELESEAGATGVAATAVASTTEFIDTNTWKQYSTFVVAADDSTDAGKDIADYVCDGVNDHSTISQALGASTESGRRRVLLLEGTYYLAGMISLPDNTWLQGQGMGVTVLYWQGYSDPTPVLFDTQGDNITLSDFSVDHAYSTDPITIATCRTIQVGNTNIVVRNVQDMDNDDGVFLYGDSCEGPIVMDGVVLTMPSGGTPGYSVHIVMDNSLDKTCEGVHISKCNFGSAPMKLVGGESAVLLLDDVFLTGLTVANSSLEADGMELEQIRNVSFVGNAFTGSGAGASIKNVIGLTCNGNTFEGTGDGLDISYLYDLDVVSVQNRALSIVGNVFRNDGDAIALAGPNYGPTAWPGDHGDQNAHTVVVGNQFYTDTFGSSRAINLDGAADILINGNEFTGYETPIDVDGKRVTITGNIFTGCGYIDFTGSCRDVQIWGNQVFDAQYEAIRVSEGLVGGSFKDNYLLHGSQYDGTDPWIHTVTGAVVSDLTIEGNKFRKGRSGTQATYCLVLNASETVWSDAFTDDNDTDILDHSPGTGTEYAYLGTGTFTIQGNKLSSTTLPNGYACVVADRGVAATEINIKWKAGSQQQFALMRVCFRLGGLRDYFYVFLQPTADRIRLRKLVNNNMIQLGSYSVTLSHTVEYALKITLDGDDIDIYHDGGGSPCISVTDSDHSEYTGVGIFTNTFDDLFDDLSIKVGDYGTVIKDNDFRNGAAADVSVGANVDVVYFGENLMTDGTIYDQEATRRETMAFLGV